MALLKPQHRDGTSRSHKGKGTCSSNQGERKDILRGPRHARPVPLRNILSSRSVTSVPRDNAQSCVTGRSGKGALLDDVGIEAQRRRQAFSSVRLVKAEIGSGGLLKARGAHTTRGAGDSAPNSSRRSIKERRFLTAEGSMRPDLEPVNSLTGR